MNTYNCLPPFVHLSAPRPISPGTALKHIKEYLAQTEKLHNPHLHPDCIFTEHGPSFAGHASAGGLILHQLRRVEAGLRGRRLGAEIEGARGSPLHEVNGFKSTMQEAVCSGEDVALDGFDLPEGDDSRLNQLIEAQAGEAMDIASHAIEQELGDERVKNPWSENWRGQNYQEQLREQGNGITEGEIGDRDNVVGNISTVPQVQSTNRKRPISDVVGDDFAKDKEARKRAKKEKHKLYKKEKEEGWRLRAQLNGGSGSVMHNGADGTEARTVPKTKTAAERQKGSQRHNSIHGANEIGEVDTRYANDDPTPSGLTEPPGSLVDNLGDPTMRRPATPDSRARQAFELLRGTAALAGETKLERREAKRARRKSKVEARRDSKLPANEAQMLEVTVPPMKETESSGGREETKEERRARRRAKKEQSGANGRMSDHINKSSKREVLSSSMPLLAVS